MLEVTGEKLKEAMDSLVEVNLNETVQIKDEFLKASIQKELGIFCKRQRYDLEGQN